MPLKYVKIALIAVLSCTIFKPTFSWMVARFEETESFYAHGYLVPFVAAFLVFRLKDKLKAAEPRVYDKGLAMLVIFLCLHLLASFFEINFLSGLCFIGCLSALMLYNCGPAFLRVIAFPLFFLVFMVPAPNAMTLGVSFYLKIIAANTASLLIGIIVPLKNSGSMIYLPNGVLTVGAPCSGLKSLMSLAALSLLFAYLTNFSLRKKILFFLLSLPVAFAANVLRIMLLILVFYVYGSEVAMGWFHDFSGMLVFVFAFIGLIILREIFISWRKKPIAS